MKTTLNWYKREANYYNQLGQRLLHKKFGFAGVGKFAALCDILVTLPNCSIDVKNDKNAVTMLGLDLDFSPDEFLQFLNRLIEFDLLITTESGKLSTPEIQESLSITLEERAKAYYRKYGKQPKPDISDSYGISSGELSESSTEQKESSGKNKKVSKNISQREREREKPEKKEREKTINLVFNKEFFKECSETFEVGILKIENKQNEFLKFQQLKGKTWKKPNDLKEHFINWLKLELEKEKNAAKKEKPTVTGKVNY